MTKAIIMLTYNDLTIPDAVKTFQAIRHIGITHIGFKDKGILLEEAEELVKLMREENMEIYYEIVSETEQEALDSARKAIELKVDYLIGGQCIKDIMNIIKNSRIKYYPYIGRVISHPCLLRGTLDEIIADAKSAEKLGVDGINLLAYRWDGNSNQLITAVKNSVNLPLIIAGDIDSFQRIRFVTELNISAFTIGSALFDKKFVPKESLSSQIISVLREKNRCDG